MRVYDVKGGYGGLDHYCTRDDFEIHFNYGTEQTPLNPPHDVKTKTRNPPVQHGSQSQESCTYCSVLLSYPFLTIVTGLFSSRIRAIWESEF